MVKVQIDIAPAKPAATLVILRDGIDGLNVFMVQRAGTMAFGANAFVFPGGKVDDADAVLAGDDPLGDYRCAALREAFEECGLLLVKQAGRALSAQRQKAYAPHRDRVLEGAIAFHKFLEQNNLQPLPESLIYIGRWITPDHLPKRFDARFFATIAPEGQVLDHDGYECVHSEWVRPAHLLARAETGDVYLMPPTFHVLTDLAQWENARDALAALTVSHAQAD